MPFTSNNPATGKPIRTYDETPPQAISSMIEEGHRAFLRWRALTFAERADPLRRAAAALRERTCELATLMAQEMGKPIRDGTAEVDKCAQCCEYFAEHASKLLAREMVEVGAVR